MRGERSVVGLDIHLEVAFKAVFAQKRQNRRRIEIILMLRGLFGLGFDQELSGKADLLCVIDRHFQEPRKVIQLQPHIGVEQGFVPFASAPEDIVLAAELHGNLDGFFDLRGGIGKHRCVGRGCRAVDELRVSEAVGGAPEAFDARARHLLLDYGDHLVENAVGLQKRVPARGKVRVVKAEETNLHLFHELKRRVHAFLGAYHVIFRFVPWSEDGHAAKRIHAAVGERVPPGHRKAQMLLHGLSGHDFVRVVILERKRVGALCAFIADGTYFTEVCHVIRS